MGTTIREALAAANKKLMGKIDDAMNNEVFKEIQDEEAATIYEVIYKVYTPRMYRRRGEYGGMADPYNIEIEGGTSRGGVMAVVNLTDPNPGGYERGTGDDREKSSTGMGTSFINTTFRNKARPIWGRVLLLQKRLNT